MTTDGTVRDSRSRVAPPEAQRMVSGSRALELGEFAERGQNDIKRLQGRLLLQWRMIVGAIVVVPILGMLTATTLAWQGYVGTPELMVFAVFYFATGLGISIGYHRLFTHLSYKAHPGVRFVLAVLGAMALEGPVIRWVADHRRHHRFTDVPGDPHSPHQYPDAHTPRGIVRSLLHAHFGWFFDEDKTRVSRYAPDLLKDPVLRAVDRLYVVWACASVLVPGVVSWAIRGTPEAFVVGALFGGLARIFFVQHITWSINSVCHMFGSRPYRTRDESRNNALLAGLSFGECWHNNHHAFPASSRLGHEWWQLDVGWIALRVLKRLNLVRGLNVPGPSSRRPRTVSAHRQVARD